jgi:hypothetical protein
MSVGNRTRSLGLIAAIGCLACGGNPAPNGWLPAPREAQTAAYGGWIEVDYTEGQSRRLAKGELIAASADSIWVLGDSQAVVVATSGVESGKLYAYAPQLGDVTGWTLAGIVSTISNGVFLIFTAPAWLVTGGFAGQSEARAARRTSPPRAWAELAMFARFPQGLPEGLELGRLQRKQTEPNEVAGAR